MALLQNTLFSGKNEYNDARVTTFSKLADITDALYISLLTTSKCSMQKDWWREQLLESYDACEEEIQHKVLTSSIFIYMYGFVAYFSTFEASIRSLLRGVDPSACNNANSSLASVYPCLLSKLNLENDIIRDMENTIRFASKIRNTIHNNGVHTDKFKEITKIEWNKKTFLFINNKRLEFADDWSLTIALFSALKEILWVLINCDVISNNSDEFTDPLPLIKL